MNFGTAHVDQLSIALEEMRRVALVEGVETLLIVATKHRSDGLSHRFVSVGSIEGCDSCAMESLGRLIGMEMPEMLIADHLHAIQLAYVERTSKPPVNEAAAKVWSLEEAAVDRYYMEFSCC
jgi:hypothetical protein